MALDPTVHITNGIPDVGTGNITTLGMTIAPQGANLLTGRGADVASAAIAGPMVQGSSVSSAPTYTNGTVNPLTTDLSGNLRAVINNTVPVSGTFWQATQPISGNVGITGTVTVSGTVNAAQSGTWNITNISGTISLPTGAATAAKQPALGTAGVPSTDVITVQGATSMTPLKIDGSAVTQPISGNVGITGNVNCVQVTSPWVTSISGNVTCVQSGNWTTRVVGNSGNAVDFPSTYNVAVPAASLLIGGQFLASPGTITTGNVSPLQVDNVGSLLVNIKSSTTIAVSQSGTWPVRLQDGSGTAITSTGGALDINIKSGGGSGGTSSNFGSAFPSAGTAIGAKDSGGTLMQPLNLDGSGNLKVNVAAGGASGGTSSSFGAAVPATGTAAGFSDGTNMQLAHVWDGDSGAGTQWVQGVLLKTPASGGAVDIGVSGKPLIVDGSAVTQPVSLASTTITGTVAVTQSGSWNVGQSGTWNVGLNAGSNIVGKFTTDQTTPGTTDLVHAAQQGTWNIGTVSTISGTVSVNGAVVNSADAVATSSTNVGNVSYNYGFNGTTWDRLQVDGSKNLKIAVNAALPAGANTIGAVTQGAAPWTVKPDGTVWTLTSTSANVNVTNTIPVRVSGAAGGIFDFGSSYNVALPNSAILVGAQYNSAQAAMTSGNVSPIQTDKVGRLLAVGALRSTKGRQKTSITVNTATNVVPAGAAGVFNDVYAIVITNKSATAVTVDINDGAGVVMTLAAPAGDTRGFTVPVDSAIPQSGAAAAWTATVSAAVTSIEITMLYVSNL